ncbi:DNA recombination protein RmuC [Steroidobacter sp. S1-65]|uniref:DNA recombination protein RmuC n=1 Tax=Steroidobacter gossypii TaxID=2805490 RepID=A0ABS1WWF0_9GAMM|nr:DNA recombination protein RmuC [Steroidobacter gossypii]MBM0105310.1 DNA recombination protein RmuC [Steroidobacter gossypii]
MAIWLIGSVALVVGVAFGALIASLRSRQRAQSLHVELAVLKAQIKGEEQLERERHAALERSMERLKSSFDSIANQSLHSNSELFLKLAREHLTQHQQYAVSALTEREKAIESMLAPIREALGKTEQQILRIEKERAETFGSLKSSLESVALGQQALQKETRTLVNALRRPEVRGQWGEMTLRRLAELAGMVEHCDFKEQVHVRVGDSNLRPDMIVHMPDGRDLVVDVKTPLDAYLEAVDAATDEQRAMAMRRHANAIAERVKQLGAKSYWAQFERSPDFVILFIPGDQFLSAALAEQPNLLEDAIRQDVIIATPSSFVALLKAVAYGWRQMALAQNAETIRTLAEDLYKRLAVFTTHLGKLGRNLGNSVDHFNAAIGSLERQVLPGARKFTELGVRPDREMETLEPIDKLVREPAENGERKLTGTSDAGPN